MKGAIALGAVHVFEFLSQMGPCDFVPTLEKLNSVTKLDSYPLPRVDDYVDKIGRVHFVST